MCDIYTTLQDNCSLNSTFVFTDGKQIQSIPLSTPKNKKKKDKEIRCYTLQKVI